ncbi:MAG TPA: F0F1 ATP synthase subunit A [Saprospiraceae bacterium]|nr:F0F1 ATP synthase subunit A [Saprospiraceae bacterium]
MGKRWNVKLLFSVLIGCFVWIVASASEDNHSQSCAGHDHHSEFNVGETALHHISDANVFSIGPFQLPLPCILYAPGHGWDVFISSRFQPDFVGHGDGHMAYNRYVLHGGVVRRIADDNFPSGEIPVHGFIHREEIMDGAKKDVYYACIRNEWVRLDSKSTADGGLFGGGITSYYDFSLTKNVVSMLLMFLFLSWLFISISRSYADRVGKAPKGAQSLFEPIIVFLRDEVAKPFLGHHWERFFPLLLSLFFFILALNLFGQVPFLGNANVTGNLAVTMALALVTFLVTNLNGNKHYWSHLFLAPGVPAFVKPILIPVELLGIFIKPMTLMLRLFANITAGHIVMVVFVGLIFIFGKSGESLGGTAGAAVGSAILTMFMMAIELIVAFVQAFVFTILTASYIGAATEEVHH